VVLWPTHNELLVQFTSRLPIYGMRIVAVVQDFLLLPLRLTVYLILLVVCEGLRILVMLLLDTLPMLGNVLMLCFFVFFIFGIVGVQLWSGRLRNRCYLVLPENISAERSDSIITHSLFATLVHCINGLLFTCYDFHWV